jgi:hypothetical protein
MLIMGTHSIEYIYKNLDIRLHVTLPASAGAAGHLVRAHYHSSGTAAPPPPPPPPSPAAAAKRGSEWADRGVGHI